MRQQTLKGADNALSVFSTEMSAMRKLCATAVFDDAHPRHKAQTSVVSASADRESGAAAGGAGYARAAHLSTLAGALAIGSSIAFGPQAWADDAPADAAGQSSTDATTQRGQSSAETDHEDSSTSSSDPEADTAEESDGEPDAETGDAGSADNPLQSPTATEVPDEAAPAEEVTPEQSPEVTDTAKPADDEQIEPPVEDSSPHDPGRNAINYSVGAQRDMPTRVDAPTGLQRADDDLALTDAGADTTPPAVPVSTTVTAPELDSDQAVFGSNVVDAPTPDHPASLGDALGAASRSFFTFATDVIEAVLDPTTGKGPLPSPESPLSWAALGWVRRQADAELIADQPTVATATEVAAAAPPAVADEPTGLPAELERTTLVSGLYQPTDFRFLPDGRILITEKSGAVKVYEDGELHSEPLITLVVLPTDNDEERGLLGIEVDPDFENNGYLYVAYTTAANRDRLSRITVVGDIADPASELVLLESDQPGEVYHHGGEVQFGPDGKLYWAMGMNTFNPNSQDLSNIHGKILRLNPDGSVPPDNPFVDVPGAIPQIWAYGLRNPFRFTFTPNGKLLTGDVGGASWEELNIVIGGANYGWPTAEGVCDGCSSVNPIYTYPHTAPPASAGSITSVLAYTGSTFPADYRNKVFIADYTLGWIKELTFDSEYTSFISERIFDPNAGTVVKLAQGPDGNIYQLNIYPGTLSRIAPSGGNRAPGAVITATPSNGLSPLTVHFSATGSTDPDPGTSLSYTWDFGDGTTASGLNAVRTYTAVGTYDVVLTVSDGNKTGRATQRVTVGSTAPVATILTPLQNSPYNAGDIISFSGTGTDAEDGALPESAYRWTIEFRHADHVHPFRDNIIGSGGTVTIPRGADNIDTTWYRLILTVTDSSGLSSSRSVDIKPRLVTLNIVANNPDAVFTVDGIPKRGSFTETAVVGVERVLDAPSPQYGPDGGIIFDSWSDGQPQSHTITTPAANTTYTVNFDQFITPPAPWTPVDIGQPTFPGYSSYRAGVYTIRGGGGDIWGPTDEFHYLHQGFSGDGTIIARVTSQTDTDDWAKSGIMIKESATPGAKYVLLAVTPANGITFQHNFNGDSGSAPYTLPNGWLKLERTGNTFTGYTSLDGAAWIRVGQTTLDMATDVTAGLAVTAHSYSALNTTTFAEVSVISTPEWTSVDIGDPPLAGNTDIADGVHTITGSGYDIWGEADQFHFSYQSLPANGSIVTRVASFTDTTDGWAKAGVMVKASAEAGSPYALLAVTPEHGINFQHSFDQNIAGPATAPAGSWLKLNRTGDTVTASTSTDGLVWTEVGSVSIALGGNAVVGLFVSAHAPQLSTAAFDNVEVDNSTTIPTPLPSHWASTDVGTPRLAGSASYSSGTYTLNGAGDDIWGEADQFHFVHQGLAGDGEIIARVTAQEDTDGWAKAGVMIKASAEAGSPYALLAVTPEHGINFQHGFQHNIAGPATAPAGSWLKLNRTGNTVTASTSTDGLVWTEVGTVAVPLTADSRIGLFVTAHNGYQLSTSKFDNVRVSAPASAVLA